MKAAFHYVVRVKLIRYKTKDDIDFIKYEKIFSNENPIVARHEAFIEYQEWINDLYVGIGKSGQYSNDKQARADLQLFITHKDKHQIQINKNKFDIDNSLDYGIGVYFIIDIPYQKDWEEDDDCDKVGDEKLIHGIGISEKYNDPLEISDALNSEILYYENYNYNKGGLERNARFYDWFLGDAEEISFLETPFDWTGLDVKGEETSQEKRLNWFFNELQDLIEEDSYSSSKYVDIIANGEGNGVEFKPTLLYNFKTQKAGIGVKSIIAKAICAFLNSNGGLLFIGLNNDGTAQGLEYDFSLSDKPNAKDFFQNEFDQMIEHFLSFSVMANISARFEKINGKEIFIVSVEPSKHRPIFMNGQNGKEFWIRGQAGNRQPTNERNRQIVDIEELVKYCIEKWGNLIRKTE